MPTTRALEIDTEPSAKSLNRSAASSLRRAPSPPPGRRRSGARAPSRTRRRKAGGPRLWRAAGSPPSRTVRGWPARQGCRPASPTPRLDRGPARDPMGASHRRPSQWATVASAALAQGGVELVEVLDGDGTDLAVGKALRLPLITQRVGCAADGDESPDRGFEPALQELAEGSGWRRRLGRRLLGHERGQRLVGLPLGPPEGPGFPDVPAGQRVAAGVDPHDPGPGRLPVHAARHSGSRFFTPRLDVTRMQRRPREGEGALRRGPLTCCFVERTTGFEPATPTLARLCSTTEPRPRCDPQVSKRAGRGHEGRALTGRCGRSRHSPGRTRAARPRRTGRRPRRRRSPTGPPGRPGGRCSRRRGRC